MGWWDGGAANHAVLRGMQVCTRAYSLVGMVDHALSLLVTELYEQDITFEAICAYPRHRLQAVETRGSRWLQFVIVVSL